MGSSSVRILDHRVQELGLVEDLPHRFGLVQGGDRSDLHPVLPERRHRGAKVGLPVADVRSQAEIADGGLAQSGPSSSMSASRRSWTTSTPTSSTASGKGGSGLAARTRTDSQAKRSISRSPITWQRRSSVL